MSRPDPTILAFDTSAAHCAAALLRGGKIVAERVEPMERGQGERLIGLLEEMLADTGESWSSLDAIGVGVGPGNFTGIRISVGAARAIALAGDLPAIGVNSLEAFAFGNNGLITVSLDARGGRRYVQQFEDGASVSDPAVVEEKFPQPSGAGVLRGEDQPYPISAIALIAARRLAEGPTERPKPLYLRPPDAKPPAEAPPVIAP